MNSKGFFETSGLISVAGQCMTDVLPPHHCSGPSESPDPTFQGELKIDVVDKAVTSLTLIDHASLIMIRNLSLKITRPHQLSHSPIITLIYLSPAYGTRI